MFVTPFVSKFLASRDNSPRSPRSCTELHYWPNRPNVRGIAIEQNESQPRVLVFFKMLARNQTGHTSSDAE